MGEKSMWGLSVRERKQAYHIKESINLNNNIRLQLQGKESWMLNLFCFKVRWLSAVFSTKYLAAWWRPACAQSLAAFDLGKAKFGEGVSIKPKEFDKFDLAAARIPGLDHRTVTPTQERLWNAGMRTQAHHLELVVKSPHLLPCRWKNMKGR